MSINAQNRSLPDWFTRLRTRQTVLPRFQRFEAWSHSNVRQLFNTLLQDLPVGALLVLEVGNEEPFIWRAVAGAPTTGERITEHLLDGQQRLTGLWRGLHNNYEDRTYFLFLKADEETGLQPYVDSIARWKQEGDMERRPFWVNRPKRQWKERMIPLDLCAPGDHAMQLFNAWAKEAIDDRDELDQIRDRVTAIRMKLATFNLPYLSLPVSTKRETALEVFMKMNTSATPLSTYDIVVAQVEAALGTSLHDLVADTRRTSSTIAAYYPPEDLALAAGALLQGRSPTNASYMEKDFGAKLISAWDRYLLGVKRAAEFLEEEKVFDAARLPTDVVVPVLVALWAGAPVGLDAEGRARTTLRKYMWRAFFTARYEKATATRALVDYKELLAAIATPGTTGAVVFDEKQFPLPQTSELIAAGWPKKTDRLARAILALALRHGGLDLADGGSATRASLAKREYHHLFPDSHLRNQRIPEDEIFRSLNCALVTWRTNRAISAKEPERYLAERTEGTDLGEDEVRRRLSSHLIPFDEMVAGDYKAFLTKRGELVHSAMLELCDAQPSRDST